MSKEKKKRVMVTLSTEIADEFDEIAKRMRLTKSGLVTVWVNANKKNDEK